MPDLGVAGLQTALTGLTIATRSLARELVGDARPMPPAASIPKAAEAILADAGN